ncbi:diguanylate cyclase [Rhodoferax sp.]|uniref:diguanylate cyclase domain-containing protein n=1 Tax=Rhodoferax sp. TaxID=50421 RepID=UPI0025D9FF16|nr:diguanylate cyclase [Rhodoferax sp.]
MAAVLGPRAGEGPWTGALKGWMRRVRPRYRLPADTRRTRYGDASAAVPLLAPQLEQQVAELQEEIVQLRVRQQQLEILAHHDTLTGLANRKLLQDRFQGATERAQRSGACCGLLMLDLDGFKAINDRYGHAAGDTVLVEVARRLVAAMRVSDTVARLGGDEFVVLIESVQGAREVLQMCRMLLSTLREPVHLDSGTTLSVGASIGLAMYPDDGLDLPHLLHAADQAMYACKATGTLQCGMPHNRPVQPLPVPPQAALPPIMGAHPALEPADVPPHGGPPYTMVSEADLHAQIQQLQQQYQALQADYQNLQAEKIQQHIAADLWLAQRTRELQAEALEQKKAETLQRVFYRIAERAAADLSFYDFLQTVHGLLGELLYAKNCYVCLYDARKHVLNYPYYVDERDGDVMQCNDVPYRKGLSEYVLRTGRPQLIDHARFLALQAAGDITEASGDLSFSSWLGVPMYIQGVVSGLLVVQGYEPGIGYSASDVDILSFVANHVSSAIERHQALDEVRKSEARYRTVIENVGVGVVVVQDRRMVFANPSLVRIVGHPLEFLLSSPFTATVHPDDVAPMLDRHERRLRGEDVESFYGIRVVTQQGEERSLELSAVKIEWGKRDATLLFVVDATARVHAEHTQRQTLHKQSELNDMKSRFISLASHEFRTPLAIILSSDELLKYYGDRLPESEKAEVIHTIEGGVQRMMRMLDRVLLLGKAEAQMLEFQPQPLDLAGLCHSLVEDARIQQPEARCAWLTDFAEMPASGVFDEKLLRHIFGNLLSNAIKYSPHGGTVGFRVFPADGGLVFEVSDQGIGIPEGDLAHLFEPFHRASNVGDIQGTGLGLSIVKNAVDLHGGSIQVRSLAPQGTCFSVRI